MYIYILFRNSQLHSSNREMRDAFKSHFRDCFARYPDPSVQEIRSYSANFPCLQEAKAGSCEGWATECEVRDAFGSTATHHQN